jgi:uncharacterized small protein (DUF1192 family)
MDADDLEPRRKPAVKRDLTPLSLDELNAYIVELQSEIARAQGEIAAKRAQRSGAEGLFRR